SMASISSGGSNFKPWSTYTSGAYRAYLSTARSQGPKVLGENPYAGAGGTINGGKDTDPYDGSGTSGPGATTTSLDLPDWAGSATEIGLKLLAVGAAAALVVLGAL